jgi:hypothetical protein
MMSIYKHTAQVTSAVHDELIKWARELLQEAGLDVIDVWGRFPPEGTTRSHLVLFPYRVGPEERMIDNAPGANLILPSGTETQNTSVPGEWVKVGQLIADQLPVVFPNVQAYDPRRPPTRSPFPPLSELAPPLKRWYEGQTEESGWVISDGKYPHARPPSMFWRKGIRVSAYYMVVAGDPGRGTSQRTSDTAPLSLSALSVLSVGIQRERTLSVEVPPRPVPEDFLALVSAYTEALEKHHDQAEAAKGIREVLDHVQNGMRGEFQLSPVHDLNNQEFALLTQALQRPLEAILNIRLRIPVGNWLDFQPGTTVFVKAFNKGRENAPAAAADE